MGGDHDPSFDPQRGTDDDHSSMTVFPRAEVRGTNHLGRETIPLRQRGDGVLHLRRRAEVNHRSPRTPSVSRRSNDQTHGDGALLGGGRGVRSADRGQRCTAIEPSDFDWRSSVARRPRPPGPPAPKRRQSQSALPSGVPDLWSPDPVAVSSRSCFEHPASPRSRHRPRRKPRAA